jgi:hypothetical protein
VKTQLKLLESQKVESQQENRRLWESEASTASLLKAENALATQLATTKEAQGREYDRLVREYLICTGQL